jgi:hypothetical protein
MAWNPSREVAIARDVAAKIAPGVEQTIIFYITDAGQLGYASYGKTKEKCAEAKWLADKLFVKAMEEIFRAYQD